MFVETYPHWKNREKSRDSSTMQRMRANLADLLRIFGMQ